MNVKDIIRRVKSGQGENRLYRVLVPMQAAAILLLLVQLMQSRERIIIVPPELNGKAEVAYNSANTEYKEGIALFLAQLLGNITPENADFVKSAIGPFLDPSIYNDVMREVERQVNDFKVEHVAQSFKPKKLFTEAATGKVFAFGAGILEGVSGNTQKADQSFEFVINVRRFRPLVTALETYQGEPRTKEVLERMHQQELQRAERERERGRTGR
ncbi:hypothetical protein FZ983_27270 [Azospirillum sp. B21]|uniref:TraE/TraK family type IV conjugative transfer system protein n=1 Tax=Azospirillum sp. B21 TaxID=2607496 RepID=UPI0011ED7A57|nr:TraE/TraK family type IV conjugative transfer system protein [Azospirillum sp. B21]KAA0574604.1 hypothetical protein FZ983_27270 [Azospirillum sp. B21]